MFYGICILLINQCFVFLEISYISTWVLNDLRIVQCSLTWHILQADISALIKYSINKKGVWHMPEALCFMSLKQCMRMCDWTRPMYVNTAISNDGEKQYNIKGMTHRMVLHLVMNKYTLIYSQFSKDYIFL